MFVTPLQVEATAEPGEWRVLTPLVWTFKPLGVLMTPEVAEYFPPNIVVPANFVTDLASVPKPLRPFLDPTGPSRRAAVMHDWLYCSQNRHDYTRGEADQLFAHALRAEGVSAVARSLYYRGVRVGGGLYWKKRSGGLNAEDFANAEPKR